jgi:hypothetical protein
VNNREAREGSEGHAKIFLLINAMGELFFSPQRRRDRGDALRGSAFGSHEPRAVRALFERIMPAWALSPARQGNAKRLCGLCVSAVEIFARRGTRRYSHLIPHKNPKNSPMALINSVLIENIFRFVLRCLRELRGYSLEPRHIPYLAIVPTPNPSCCLLFLEEGLEEMFGLAFISLESLLMLSKNKIRHQRLWRAN